MLLDGGAHGASEKCAALLNLQGTVYFAYLKFITFVTIKKIKL